MTEQMPVISTSRNVATTEKKNTSLIGRGLSAIQCKEPGLAHSEMDARYRQARDIYNRITDYGWERRFNSEAMPKCSEQLDLFEDNQLLQLQPFFALLQQLADVFTVFQHLVDQGYGKAYFPLANMYWGGQGINKNIEKANYYSQMAFSWCFANQTINDPKIWMDLADLYLFGVGVESDHKQTVFWYRRAAEHGDVYAQSHLGSLMSGSCIEGEFKEAPFWCRKAAEQNHASAQFDLGCMYRDGQGVQRDDEEAVFWYRKAAEQDHVDAQFHLGLIFAQGRYRKQASFWYWKCAEQGYAPAQEVLGKMHANGSLGTKQDDKKAVFWFLKAIEQDYMPALFNLSSVLYAKGRHGTKQDDEKVAACCLRLAEKGNVIALLSLGRMFERIELDYEKAVFWYRKAAEQGNAIAQENLKKLGINWKNT